MADKIKTKANNKLKNRFRFVILNDETFEEKFALSLTRTNVWLFMGTVSFTLIFLTAAAIIYTPLKYFIPGFGDYNYRGEILQLQFKADSLSETINARELWLENLMNVAQGNIDTTKPVAVKPGDIDKSKIKLNDVSDTDRELRKEVEDDENFALSVNGGKGSLLVEEVRQLHPIVPVNGYVTDGYDPAKQHFGIDIAAKEDAPVMAVLDGKVVSSSYTLETGYVIAIQHSNNLISLYKHNAKLLKKEGDAVRAGEVIAFAGNTGENTSGPHLHFELWHEGRSLNPKDYIVF
jgi:murein DD-endopeptidase MepM/ murein hydrolase activator NlpD